jgi:hypothetical protein
MTDTTPQDPFDRILGDLTGLPNYLMSRPSTVATVLPILGNAQTYVVRTLRTDRATYIGFVEMIEAGRHIRIAIPAAAMAAIYRQRDSLVTQSRRSAGRERYAREHPGWAPQRRAPRKPRRKRTATT